MLNIIDERDLFLFQELNFKYNSNFALTDRDSQLQFQYETTSVPKIA